MKNLAHMLFMSELMGEVFKALHENRTVIALEYSRRDAIKAGLQFELRITRTGDLRMPVIRNPIARDEFEKRVIETNARDLVQPKARPKGKQR